MKHKISVMLLSAALVMVLVISGFAADGTAEYCFADTDFAESGTLDGIFLSQVPEMHQGGIFLGSRQLRAGDVIPSELLDALRLKSDAESVGDATVVFYPISDGHVTQPTALKIPLGSKKNSPPAAEDCNFETYKNIPNSGTLSVTDPDGDSFAVNLVKEPRRGTVIFGENGTFTYTPMENKVGKDTFVFTATDSAGNTSQEATVTIQILKPLDKTTYADMSGDSDHFYAVWLRDQGLLTGEQVAGYACFNPEKEVTRGEFLAMTMKLLDAKPEQTALTTGFADEKNTPSWLQPYLVSALKSGMITGVTSDDGMVFRPSTALTKAEAAVMLQNALNLPGEMETEVFAEYSAVPAWAQSSYTALSCAGIQLNPTLSAETMTRRETARLLYQVSSLLKTSEEVSLPWLE